MLLNLRVASNSISLCLFFLFLNSFNNNLLKQMLVVKNNVAYAEIDPTRADRKNINDKTVTFTLTSDEKTKVTSKNSISFAFLLISLVIFSF